MRNPGVDGTPGKDVGGPNHLAQVGKAGGERLAGVRNGRKLWLKGMTWKPRKVEYRSPAGNSLIRAPGVETMCL